MSQALQKQEAARWKIDQEILALKNRRNTLSPINQLPPEVLSRIFTFCVVQPTRHWVRNVTHICRHWRTVALDFPELWSTISIVGHSATTWAEEMFRRSKMANLSITIDRPTHQVATILQSVLGHPERIAGLHITGGHQTYTKQIFALLSSPAPFLSSFSLNIPGHGSPLPIQEHIFSGETPKLRQLELRGCYYPGWDSPMLCNLTSLKINVKPATRPTIKQLASVLKSSCCIRHLELIDCLPEEKDTAISPALGEVIFLKDLVEFRIRSNAPACSSMLNHISFRPSAIVKLDIDCGETHRPEVSGEQLLRLFSSLAHSLDVTKTAPFREMILLVSYQSLQLGMVIKPSEDIHEASYKEKDFLVGCNFQPSMKLHIVERLLDSAIPSISLKHLVRLRLHFTDDCTVPTSAWLSCLREMPALQWIFLNGTCNFFEALRLDLDLLIDQEEQSTERYQVHLPRAAVLPKLQNIHLEGMNFTRRDAPLAELLVDLFIERYERGVILDELHIEDCRVLRDTDIDKLEEIIGTVNWDYETMDESDYESGDSVEYNYGFEYDFDDYDSDNDSGDFYPF